MVQAIPLYGAIGQNSAYPGALAEGGQEWAFWGSGNVLYLDLMEVTQV